VPPEKGIRVDDQHVQQRELEQLERAQTDMIATVPFVIRVLHPRLKAEQFTQLRNDPLFKARTAYLCEDCYLYLGFSDPASGVFNRDASKNNLVGTAMELDPTKTKKGKMKKDGYEGERLKILSLRRSSKKRIGTNSPHKSHQNNSNISSSSSMPKLNFDLVTFSSNGGPEALRLKSP